MAAELNGDKHGSIVAIYTTARLMTKTTHGLAAADVPLYKTASRGYH